MVIVKDTFYFCISAFILEESKGGGTGRGGWSLTGCTNNDFISADAMRLKIYVLTVRYSFPN